MWPMRFTLGSCPMFFLFFSRSNCEGLNLKKNLHMVLTTQLDFQYTFFFSFCWAPIRMKTIQKRINSGYLGHEGWWHMFCHFQLPGFSSSPISKAQNPSAALTSLLVERSIADHCRSQMLGTKEVSRSIQ
jgi:hypothetical protein